MASWNFNIDYKKDESAEIKEKMKKLKKSRHNPKNIPIFENIFERESAPILETQKADGLKLKADGLKLKADGIKLKADGLKPKADSVKPKDPIIEGMESLLGKDGAELSDKFQDALIINNDNYNSLSDLYKKIAEKNKSTKKQKGTDTLKTLNELKSNAASTIKGADLLNSGNSGFWFPKSDVSDLPKRKAANDKSSMDAAALLGGVQNKVNLLSTQTAAATTADSAALSAEIASLKSKIDGKKLMDSDASIPSLSSPGAKAQSQVQVKGLGDQLKAGMKKASDEINYILTTVFKFLGEEIKYGGKLFLSVLMHFRDSYNYFVIVMSNGLTNNNATLSEVKVFSSEILKFTTILFTYIFVYNWYYLLFKMESGSHFSLNLDENLMKPYPSIYTFLGPSLKPTELFDWFLLTKVSQIKEYVSSKPVLFLLLAFIFFCLVLGNLPMVIMTNFLNAVNFRNTVSILSIIVSVLTLGYAVQWIHLSEIWKKASGLYGLSGIAALFGCLIASVLYLLYIMLVGAPLGILSITAYIMIYSFLGIVIYRMQGGVYETVKEIYKEVAPTASELKGTESGENEEGSGEDDSGKSMYERAMNFAKKWGNKILKFLEKYAKYVNMYLVELLIIMILLAGINTYTSQYGAVQFDKTDSQSVNNIGSPVSNAFKHLFTWLIIINTIIILFVGVRMWGKYYAMKEEAEKSSG